MNNQISFSAASCGLTRTSLRETELNHEEGKDDCVSVTPKSSCSDRFLFDIFLTTYFDSNINTERSVLHLANI